TNEIIYVGVDDHAVDLFEGQYKVPEGLAYNSYVVLDEKTAVMDTVDARFGHEWLDKVGEALDGKAPDYLIVQHMEPDHSANILAFAAAYPRAVIVGNAKTFSMMEAFYGSSFEDRRLVVKEGDTLSLGSRVLHFVFAPMVHWPEVMMTWDEKDKVLFSADAFGKFGARDAKGPWEDEARRYYVGIVGKYGAQVQSVLKKAAGLEIGKILPLHGPYLTENLNRYIDLYKTWSSYGVEEDGIFLPYTSVYGHTREAVERLADMLRERGCPKVVTADLARSDMAEAVASAFRFGKIVFATTTYNAGIFPFMREFIEHLTERNFAGRTVAFIENGTWAPLAAKTMKGMLEGCRDLTFLPESVTIRSALNEESREKLTALADALCRDYAARDNKKANKNDLTALYRLGYGLYVVTTNDGKRDNGLIVNTVTQVSDNPNRVAVCINKKNYSYHVVKNTGKMNVNCLSTQAPFAVFERFGFQSGRGVDKFEGFEKEIADNGLAFLTRYANAFLSLEVESEVDLVSHGMFVCRVTEARVLDDKPTMTYAYYQENVKPKPQTEGKKGWVCKICGYVHEGEELPEDFVCPLCKHGAADFEPIK
ncbi:MAG: flavin reductase, partial [Clostridia bacterium]|nr:flavin reductase [Clostridia bacterium]